MLILRKKSRGASWSQLTILPARKRDQEAKIKLTNDQAEVAAGARKNLFRVTRLKNLSERSLHEKLLKVLAALQSFLQRQQMADEVVQHAKIHIDTAVGIHKKSTKKLLDLLGEETGRTMKDAHSALEDATTSLHKVLHKVLGAEAVFTCIKLTLHPEEGEQQWARAAKVQFPTELPAATKLLPRKKAWRPKSVAKKAEGCAAAGGTSRSACSASRS